MAEAPGPSPLCGVCHLRRSKYICPRCNAQYCSLDCYKQHSERCTEGFYRDNATTELKSIKATEAEKQRMVEILRKLHEQEQEEGAHSGSESESDEEGGGGLSEQTLHLLAKKLAMGAEITPADLSPEELRAFHSAVAAGEVSEVVQPWRPWWLSEEAAQLELGEGGNSLVAPVEEEAAGATPSEVPPTAGSALPPPPSRPLPPLAALTRARPSPLLQHHLLDLLYAYCFVLRVYNGDYHTDPAEAADLLFALSAVLEAAAGGAGRGTGDLAARDPSPASVLLECISRACRPPAGSRQQQGVAVAVLSDVAAVLQPGRPTVITALMDLSRLLEAARRQLEGAVGGKESKRLQRQLVAAERKLLFFLAWANEQPAELYSLLVMAVGTELDKHLAATQHAQQQQQQRGGSSSSSSVGLSGIAGPPGALGRSQARPLVEEL